MTPLVECVDVTKKYNTLLAVDHINLSLERGKIIGLLGPNGSGKTTLIKILTGMTLQYEGDVFVDGKKKNYESKAKISFLPDQLYFDTWMRIKDLRDYVKDMFQDFNVQRFNNMLVRFKIEDRGLIKKLSKGNQEKLQLALVLARDADLYIFDEPIGGVDPALRQTILDTIMTERNPDSSVLLSTHQIYDVEEFFDDVIFLKEGKVLLHQPTSQVIQESGKSLLETFKEVFKYA
ncbi:MAG: ABC transporter ATP-binding protein [Candidatus Izemoplasmatales bacterium]|nr:ABC transporter ATP-binding protein [Candidatus Izemoplasmatales bacterium]